MLIEYLTIISNKVVQGGKTLFNINKSTRQASVIVAIILIPCLALAPLSEISITESFSRGSSSSRKACHCRSISLRYGP